MTEQYDSLDEKTKLMDISLKYTGGDINKAKEMVSGQYLDNIVVKGKFLNEEDNSSGVFLAFFNYINEYIASVVSILSSSPEMFEKTRIFDEWKTLNKDLKAYSEDDNNIDSENFTFFLIDSFIGYDVFPDVQENNLDDLTKTITEILTKSFNSPTIKCQIELEPTNSLAMELAGIKIDMPGGESDDSNKGDLIEEDERIKKIEGEVKYIVEGKAIVAPIKGKNVSEISPGDKIKVFLPGSDVVSEKILKLMSAFDDEGNKLPVRGRIKARIPNDKGGYILYAFVAKGVLAKIYEEENVKIQLEQPVYEEEESSSRFDTKMIYIMGIIVGLIILTGFILLQLL